MAKPLKNYNTLQNQPLGILKNIMPHKEVVPIPILVSILPGQVN